MTAYSKTELASGEFVGINIIEITSIPHISIIKSNGSENEVILEMKNDFENLLSEIYQNYKLKYNNEGFNKDVSFEILWTTEAVNNQTYNANIKLYLIIRAIDKSIEELDQLLKSYENICTSALSMQKYEYKNIEAESLLLELKRIDISNVRAVVKDERISSLQNQMMNSCYSYDRIYPSEQDLAKLTNILVNFPNSAISFQLIPTSMTVSEKDTIEKTTQLLDTLSKGIHDHSIGNISFQLAEKEAELYKYYESNKNSSLFSFNIMIYGNAQAVESISTRLYGQLGGNNNTTTNMKFIEFSPDEVMLLENFYPYPWAINETLINKERNFQIWHQDSVFWNYYRLPYIITAEESAEFFRLPIGNDRISAGLNINESNKNSKNYSSSIINGGDIEVGKLKSSSKDDTIGFFLKDLTKHMLVVGTPGSGKTTFSVSLLDRLWKEHNIPFLVIEPAKNEYRALVQSIPDIQVFTPGKNYISPFIFNPFTPPKNVILESYKSTLKTAFAAGVSMSSPLDKIFEEAINNCYSDFRWLDTYTTDNMGKTFNISDFIKCFQETFDAIGYTGDAKNIGRAGVVRLNSLVNLFDNYNSIPIEDLLTKPTIIELAAIENSDQKALIIALLLLSILSYVNKNYVGDGNLRNVILLEEAHVLLDSESNKGEGEANPSAIAQGLLKRMLAEIRSYGVGLVIADQSPRKVGSDVVGLTNIKLGFRLVEASDKEILANSTNMNDVQIQRLSKLKPGEAYLFFDKLDEPEEVKTEDYRAKNDISISIDDDNIRKLSTYWLNRKEKLRPYPECDYVRFCSDTCDYERRMLAKEVARRIFVKNFNSNSEDFQIIKDVFGSLSKFIKAELNDEPYNKELKACVKLQLLRRIKYGTKIKLKDTAIEKSLRNE